MRYLSELQTGITSERIEGIVSWLRGKDDEIIESGLVELLLLS